MRGAAAPRCASVAARGLHWWSRSSNSPSGMESQIKKLGVIGAGQMGAGIAQVAAQSGIEVVLVDAQPAFAEKGKARIGATFEKLVLKGKMPAEVRAEALGRIAVPEGGGYGGFADCDLVIEAATENQD